LFQRYRPLGEKEGVLNRFRRCGKTMVARKAEHSIDLCFVRDGRVTRFNLALIIKAKIE
jgi:hypothetical protein